MHQDDKRALQHLCNLHETLQTRVICLDYYDRQTKSNSSERQLIEAISSLHKLRYEITECFINAIEAIEANPAVCSNVMYVPLDRRQVGNNRYAL